jgi:hypothetical protein
LSHFRAIDVEDGEAAAVVSDNHVMPRSVLDRGIRRARVEVRTRRRRRAEIPLKPAEFARAAAHGDDPPGVASAAPIFIRKNGRIAGALAILKAGGTNPHLDAEIGNIGRRVVPVHVGLWQDRVVGQPNESADHTVGKEFRCAANVSGFASSQVIDRGAFKWRVKNQAISYSGMRRS